MGGGDIATVSKLGTNIVALCDVDDARGAGSFKAFPKAARYKDFRAMLDKEAKNIDAVTVGTPDHTHAIAAMAAIRAGKHVYVQKPLTHTLHECRALTKAALDAKVMTSMGNQGHATEGARLTNEWIQAGVIGDVREVHVWTDRAGKLWKQGISRPTDSPPIPAALDWNLWLGPIRERPYHTAYAPFSWRGWWDSATERSCCSERCGEVLTEPTIAFGCRRGRASCRRTLLGKCLGRERSLPRLGEAASFREA